MAIWIRAGFRQVVQAVLALTTLSVAMVSLAAEPAAAHPLSVEAAMEPARVLQASLAPDGKHIAALIFNGFNRSVMLIDTADLSSRQIIQGRWASDGHYRVNKNVRRVDWVTPSIIAVDYFYGADAHDLTGKRLASLGSAVIGKAVPSDPLSTLVLVYDDDQRERLASVDARTGKSKTLRYPMPGRALASAFDERGELRALTLMNSAFWGDKTTVSQWYRPHNSSEWTQLQEGPVTDEYWTPLAARANADELIVAARHQRDTLALFTFEPLRGRFGELLAGHPKEDIFVMDDPLAGAYRSVVTLGMLPTQHWFDARRATMQKAVDQALPGRINQLSGNERGLLLIHSYGDVDPGRWFLLDTETMALRQILTAQPRIDPGAMRPMAVISYAAADGLSIPAYLTQPKGSGPQPMVVMVHGGPIARDPWAWDAEVQLLAARGYVVFQPQFRGSAGFGWAFEKAGYGQWGRAMQDDISAGVEHLIKTGVADPKRICIYGSSYGGYAAVWGLIKTPTLYRCGVTRAGVSDINELFSDWSDVSKAGRQLWRMTIGDRERDKAKFDAVSPVLNAAGIGAPLLITHGDEDVRVPIGHAKRLMRAMDRAGKPYEWLLLEGEGHGLRQVSSWSTFAHRLLDFLDRHIGTAAAAQANLRRP